MADVTGKGYKVKGSAKCLGWPMDEGSVVNHSALTTTVDIIDCLIRFLLRLYYLPNLQVHRIRFLLLEKIE